MRDDNKHSVLNEQQHTIMDHYGGAWVSVIVFFERENKTYRTLNKNYSPSYSNTFVYFRFLVRFIIPLNFLPNAIRGGFIPFVLMRVDN